MAKGENNYSSGLGSWLFVQTALLVLHFGFKIILPLWLLWFPTIISTGIIIIILLILAIIAIVNAQEEIKNGNNKTNNKNVYSYRSRIKINRRIL